MIEHQTIDGREATISYLTASWEPAEADTAALAKVMFDDGECFILSCDPGEADDPDDSGEPDLPEPDLATVVSAWTKAVLVLDRSEVLVRDIIERELEPLKGAGTVRMTEVNAIVARLMVHVTVLRTNAVKAAFRLVRSRLGDRPVLDHSLAEWAQNFLREDLRGIDTAIRTGLIAGLDNTEVARKVVGTMGLNGVDGVTEFTRHRVGHLAKVAVREAIQRTRAELEP